MKVIAFDIDGTLTRPEIRELFARLQNQDNLFVGVISGRKPAEAATFIKENNIQIDFEEMGFIKAVPLVRQKLGFFFAADEFIYVADDVPRDRIASTIATWRFVHSDDAPDILGERFL